MVARARCSALFTEGSLTWRRSATSDARKPSTSLSTQYRPLPRWQVLEGRDEGQRDRFLGLVACLGTRADVGQQHVGIALHPDRRTPPGRLRRNEGRVRQLGPRSAATGPQGVQAPVGRDLVQPRAQRRAPLVPVQTPPGGQQGLLQHVLGVLQ